MASNKCVYFYLTSSRVLENNTVPNPVLVVVVDVLDVCVVVVAIVDVEVVPGGAVVSGSVVVVGFVVGWIVIWTACVKKY